MPLPEWEKRLDKKQSLERQSIAGILNADVNVHFGPPGTSASATHPTKGDEIAGKPPRRERSPRDDNPDLRDTVGKENPDTRPRRQQSTRQ